jgi:hypothetical protein
MTGSRSVNARAQGDAAAPDCAQRCGDKRASGGEDDRRVERPRRAPSASPVHSQPSSRAKALQGLVVGAREGRTRAGLRGARPGRRCWRAPRSPRSTRANVAAHWKPRRTPASPQTSGHLHRHLHRRCAHARSGRNAGVRRGAIGQRIAPTSERRAEATSVLRGSRLRAAGPRRLRLLAFYMGYRADRREGRVSRGKRARIGALPKGERDFDPAGSRPLGTTRPHLRNAFETLSIRSRVELAGLSRSSRALHRGRVPSAPHRSPP